MALRPILATYAGLLAPLEVPFRAGLARWLAFVKHALIFSTTRSIAQEAVFVKITFVQMCFLSAPHPDVQK